VPDDVAGLIVIDRAATVVLDFFDGVPVTVRQSPTTTALRVCVAVSEKVVEAVQLTEVCPSVAFCTSMVVPEMDATLPLAPAPLGAAAAAALSVVTNIKHALSPATVADVAPQRAIPLRLRGVLRGVLSGVRHGVHVGVQFISVFVSLVVTVIYSLRSASIGAR